MIDQVVVCLSGLFRDQLAAMDAIDFRHCPDLCLATGKSDESWVKMLDVFGKEFLCVPRRITGNEEWLNPLGLLSKPFQGFGHDLEVVRTDVGAVDIAKVDQQEPPGEVGVCLSRARVIDQLEGPSEAHGK